MYPIMTTDVNNKSKISQEESRLLERLRQPNIKTIDMKDLKPTLKSYH